MELIDKALAFLAAIIPAPFDSLGFGTPQIILLILAAAVFYWTWIRPYNKENK